MCDLQNEDKILVARRTNGLDVYRKLGVQEVWIWRSHQVEVFRLHDEQYLRASGSDLLAGLDLTQLLRFIDVRPMTRAVTEYRAERRRTG